MIYSIHSIPCDSNYLEHHGIKGQKWGVQNGPPYPLGESAKSASEKHASVKATLGTYRRPIISSTKSGSSPESQSKRLRKEAAKDAKRYADAKMYYGKGAGTRRKLLKAELDKKMKNPEYKRLFEEAYAKIDLEKSANKARVERKARDTTDNVKKTVRGIVNIVLGTGLPVALSAVIAWNVIHATHADQIIKDFADTIIN